MHRKNLIVLATCLLLGCSAPGTRGAPPAPAATASAATSTPPQPARRNHHGDLLTPAGEHVYTNELILESSPDLLQHAREPVQWMAWGEKAFAKAKAENKPIFLSIGYSTCHWCHVMAREAFSDEGIAAFLNAAFVSIKVDREERPDVDDVYMTAAQVMGERV